MTIKVGIIANEFYDPIAGRMGGFGWLAKAAAQAFASSGEIEPVFITSEFELASEVKFIHGIQIIDRSGGPLYRMNNLRSAKFDRLISIDWRPNYSRIATVLLDVPLTVWVQDPRSSYDIRRIKSLAIPNSEDSPAGIDFIDCSSLKKVHELKKVFRKEIIFAGHANYLEEKVSDTYHVHNIDYQFLCDPLTHVNQKRILGIKPEVIFLGRLDPIKRPWVFLELAKRFPEIIFHFLGRNHFEGYGGWNHFDVPGNVRFHGHVEAETKQRLLQKAWVVINTSIHEALPISFLESLSMGIPILSMQNPDELASRFGSFSGRWDGDGLDGLPFLERGLIEFTKGKSLNLQIGAKGAEWVRKTHSQELFVKEFLAMHRKTL
jgi:glycosyltransferase involved in cell wall biosynthesis